MLQQRAFWHSKKSAFKLKRQLVQRPQDTPVRCPSGSRLLHCATLGDNFIRWKIERHQNELYCLSEPLNECSSFFGWNHYGQQCSVAYSEHNLQVTDANQVGIPIAQHSICLVSLCYRLGIQSVQQLLGTSESEHGWPYVACASDQLSLQVTLATDQDARTERELLPHTSVNHSTG